MVGAGSFADQTSLFYLILFSCTTVFFTQSCYVHAIPLSNAYKQQRDVNITVHSNDITQVTLYKHTESAFTWLINVAVIVKQSISISVSLETPGFRFCCNVFFFLFPQRASVHL